MMIEIRVWGPVLKRDYYVEKYYNGKIEKIRNTDSLISDEILEGEFRLIQEESIIEKSSIAMCKVDPESYAGDPKGTIKIALKRIVHEDYYVKEYDEFHMDLLPVIEDYILIDEEGLFDCIKCMNDIKNSKEFLKNTKIITRGN